MVWFVIFTTEFKYMDKLKVVTDYAKLTPELLELFNETYPHGIAGKTMPKPKATKNEEMITTWTSLGNPETGDFKRLTKTIASCLFFSFFKLHSCT